MSTTKFTSEEFISLMEAKVNKGIISLKDIKKIISDKRFPESLSKDAIKKLFKYSFEYRLFLNFDQNKLEEDKKYIEDIHKNIDDMTQVIDKLNKELGNEKISFVRTDKKISKLKNDINKMEKVFEKEIAKHAKLQLIFNKVKEA